MSTGTSSCHFLLFVFQSSDHTTVNAASLLLQQLALQLTDVCEEG